MPRCYFRVRLQSGGWRAPSVHPRFWDCGGVNVAVQVCVVVRQDDRVANDKAQRWLAIDPAQRQELKTNVRSPFEPFVCLPQLDLLHA